VITDGAELIDIRFNENAECSDYFEQCCAVNSVNLSYLPPDLTEDSTLSQGSCGLRNEQGVGFRITGNKDGEAEFGE
jgi:plasma kallikrein